MADVRKLLARLNPKVTSWEGGGGGHGGMTQSDVAAALAGLPRDVEMTLRAAYAADEAAWEEIASRLRGDMLQRSKRRRWRLRGTERWPRIFNALVEIAMVEVLSPPNCRRCKGRGVHRHRAVVKVCDRCGGSGMSRIPVAEKARRTGLHPSSFTTTWEPRLEEVVYQLRDWLDTGRRHVRDRL